MTWKIEFEAAALKDLRNLDRVVAKRIIALLEERISVLDDPRSIGEPLQGPKLGEFWKYRAGDYRIIVKIQEGNFTIVAIRTGHRREVYR